MRPLCSRIAWSTRTASIPAASISRIMPPSPTARISRMRWCAASSAGSGMGVLPSDPMTSEFTPDMCHLDHDGRQAHPNRVPDGARWLRSGADGRHYPHLPLPRAFRVIDFKFYRVGALQGADKVAKMCWLGNNIEHKMGKDQRPKARAAGCQDDLRHVGVRIVKFLQNFRPRFERAVDINQ